MSAVVAATLGASPAYAHTRSEAVEAACGSKYVILDNGVRDVALLSGEVWGEVILTYNPENEYFCVVTRKIAFHGEHTRVIAGLFHSSQGVVFHDEAKTKHLLSFKMHSYGHCTRYYGRVFSPDGDSAWGGLTPVEENVCPFAAH